MQFHENEPRYRQVADELARRIGIGALRGGDRLPSEPQLARELGVSRETVRAAMERLEERALVVRRRGVGTFVAGRRYRQDATVLAAFYDAILAHGFDPETRLLDYRLVPFMGDVAALFGDHEGMLLVRRYAADGAPFALVRSYLPRAAAQIPWSVAEANPIIRLVEDHLHTRIARADLAIRASLAGEDAPLLALEPGSPVLVMERTSWSAEGAPLELTRCHLRADVYDFSISIAGPVSIADAFRRPPPRAPAE